MGRPTEALAVEKPFMNGRVSPIRALLAIGLFAPLLIGILVTIPGHSNTQVGNAWITGSASALGDNIKPTANAGSDQNVSVGEKVRFDASLSADSGGSIANYTWSFNYDGKDTKLFGVEPSFTFEWIGEYNVTLNVTDGAGLFDTDQVVIKVAAEHANTSSLIYSGGAAAAVAALLVVLFIVMRSRKGDGGKEEPADGSEEEFEET